MNTICDPDDDMLWCCTPAASRRNRWNRQALFGMYEQGAIRAVTVAVSMILVVGVAVIALEGESGKATATTPQFHKCLVESTQKSRHTLHRVRQDLDEAGDSLRVQKEFQDLLFSCPS